MEGSTGVIRLPLGRSTKDRMKWDVQHETGRPAVTHFHVIEYLPHYSWIECKLETGRTHQIRVHMAHIRHAVVNDPLYGWKKIISDKGSGTAFSHAGAMPSYYRGGYAF